VISVTHSLGNLDLYDSVLVLYAGRVVYHGPPDSLAHYFGVEDAEDVYPALAKREPEDWATSWSKHASDYYAVVPGLRPEDVAAPASQVEGKATSSRIPNFLTQLFVLLNRRWQIFFRDRTQLVLQLAMLIIFPAVVVLFAFEGLPDLQRPSDTLANNPAAELQEQISIQSNRVKVGGLISGLVMFQVVLLALMGSNNSAREIAGERQIYEKEKLGGLSTFAYLGSKMFFLSTLVIVQSLWMYFFVAIFAQIPSDMLIHPILLILVNASMTAICLGISASMQSADQASLLSIYLVGFQLPLSGAVLALPSIVEPFIQPFISAYWSWSGIVRSLEPRYFTAVDTVTDASLQGTILCLAVLAAHLFVGIIIAFIGAGRARWNH
ncbi:MAG: ABC transporter permease, partial [Verrucomicrobiota bacterium]